jgi:tetratricopeptide (TPR) repeat protein
MAAVGKFNGGGNAFLVQRMGDGQDDVELDITHESLIRKWKTLQGWVREEAGNRDQYLRLCAAASEYRNGKGELLRGARLASDAAWVKGFAPQKEWAARYTDQDSFQRAMEFLRQSTVAKRRKDLAKSALTGFAVFAAFAVLAFAYLRNVQTQREMVEQDRIKRERNLKHGEELIGKAAGLVQKGKFDSAKELLNSAESFLSQDSAGVANVHIARGLLHLSRKLNSTVTAIQDYSEADREFDLAEGIASHTSNRYIRGQALLNKGGIYRMRQLSDSALLCYQAAAASFDSAGEMGSAAEAYESEAHLLEHEYQQNKQAVDRYTDARERFRISGNLRGLTRTTEAIDSLVNYVNKSAESTKAKKIAASGTDRTPWGWLQDLATGEKFTLMSPDVKVGRNTAEIKNDIAFTDRMVSRKHLFLNSRSMASDLRSMNGTSLNALNLSYEHDDPFKSGAIFVLAGRHALLFGKSEPKDLRPAGGAWGLCIIAGNGPSSNGAYAYLSGDLESLTLRGSSLALETGTSGAALALVRGGAKGTEIKDMDDEWSLLVTVKESDYEYNQYIAKPSEWLQVDTPTMFAKLDNDRQVIQKGPAFQIVPLNAQDQ